MIDFQKALYAQLASFTPYLAGNIMATVLVVKKTAGPFERAGGLPFSGKDGEALEKAFLKLGYGKDAWIGLLASPEGSPVLRPSQLRSIAETIDPLTIIAVDEGAAHLLMEAFASEISGLLVDFQPEVALTVQGRLFVWVDAFESSLNDDARKRRAWAQLKHARR